MFIHNIALIVNQISQRVDFLTIKVKYIIMSWILSNILIKMTPYPRHTELCEWEDFWWLLE